MTLDEFARLIVASELMDEFEVAVLSADFSDKSAAFFAGHLVARQILSRWQCDKLLEGRWKGFFLDHYKLLDYIDDSNEGPRYKAEYLRTRKLVAISINAMVGHTKSQPFSYTVEPYSP